MVASADFVYTKGTNLATLVNLNQNLPNAAGNNALGALPYPNFGNVHGDTSQDRLVATRIGDEEPPLAELVVRHAGPIVPRAPPRAAGVPSASRGLGGSRS